MQSAQEPDVKQKFKELYVDYKLAVTAAYFSNLPQQPISEGAATAADADHQPVPTATSWEGPNGIKASTENPILARLATPKLPSDLAQHLQK